MISDSLAMLRRYPRAETWIISLYHLGRNGFVRGTDLMDVISRNGRSNTESPASADRILRAMESEQILRRGKVDLTGSLGPSTAAFRCFDGAIGDYPRDYAWTQGEKFSVLIAAMKEGHPP